MRTIEEIFGEWTGPCTYVHCLICTEPQSTVYRRAACPGRTLEDEIVDAGGALDYLGQRAEILKLRERRAGDEP